MKLIATLVARDEEDIIGHNIEHHLAQGVDRIILTDNGSVDATRSIAECYKEVDIIDEPVHDYRHGEWVTNMARQAYVMGADWVINIDADEFWYGLSAMRDIVNSVSILRLPPNYDFVPFVDAVPGPFDPTKIPFWTRSPTSLRLAHRSFPQVIVEDGNHQVRNCPGGQLYTNKMYVKHYPLRSYQQFEKKVIKGGKALLESPQEDWKSTHWRHWYKAWEDGTLLNEWQLVSIDRNDLPDLVSSRRLEMKYLL